MILINYWTNNVLITNHYFEKIKKNIQKYFLKKYISELWVKTIKWVVNQIQNMIELQLYCLKVYQNMCISHISNSYFQNYSDILSTKINIKIHE